MEKRLIDEALTMTVDLAVYEISYLLLPSLAFEQIPTKATVLKEVITSFGGVVISDEDPVLIDLAYSMTKLVGTTRHKVSSGYFGWVKFQMPKENTAEVTANIKKNLDANPEILRYLIVKTVRENTLLNGKMKLQKEDRVRRDAPEGLPVEDVESVTEISKDMVPEEIDKSIDDLVIV